MFTKLTNQTTAAADKTVPQVIFEVGQLNPNVMKAKIKNITVNATSTDTTDRILKLQAVANNGTTINLAQQDNFQIGTAGSFYFDKELWMSQERNNNSIRKLQLAISDLTSAKAYTSTVVVNYE